MKFISVDVSALDTHEEKRKVFESFRNLGWLEFKHFIVQGAYPNLDVKKWGFCWDSDETLNPEPQYPELPQPCKVSDFNINSSNQ